MRFRAGSGSIACSGLLCSGFGKFMRGPSALPALRCKLRQVPQATCSGCARRVTHHQTAVHHTLHNQLEPSRKRLLTDIFPGSCASSRNQVHSGLSSKVPALISDKDRSVLPSGNCCMRPQKEDRRFLSVLIGIPARRSLKAKLRTFALQGQSTNHS